MKLSQEDLAGLIDADALRARLTALTSASDGDGSDMKIRNAVLAELKQVVKEARGKVQERLDEDGGGLLCAGRLSFIQDELIRVIYDFALYHVYRITNPSAAERMSIAAVGGHARFLRGGNPGFCLVLWRLERAGGNTHNNRAG